MRNLCLTVAIILAAGCSRQATPTQEQQTAAAAPNPPPILQQVAVEPPRETTPAPQPAETLKASPPAAPQEPQPAKAIVEEPPPSENEPPPEDSVAIVEFGKAYKAPGLQISITDARLTYPLVTDIFGDKKKDETERLVITLRIVNTSERKILRYRGDNPLLEPNFILLDDAQNQIRRIDYGLGSKPAWKLTGEEDIGPGKVAWHKEVFAVPPSKTQYLALALDLAAFGGKGAVGFAVPVDKIKGF